MADFRTRLGWIGLQAASKRVAMSTPERAKCFVVMRTSPFVWRVA